MKIKCNEPISQKYIYVDPRNNHVHLVMPLVGGESIGLDNTCQTVVELQRFFGKNTSASTERKSAIHELERYQAALEKDLNTLDESKAKKEKKDRLEQVKEYLKALKAIENEVALTSLGTAYPNFPDAVKRILGQQTNVLCMRLSPSHPDPILKTENPVFSVSREGISILSKYSMRDTGVGLGPTLRQEFSNLTIGPKQDAKALVQAAVVRAFGSGSLNNEDDFNRLKNIIHDQIKALYNIDVDLSRMNKANPLTKDRPLITKEFLDSMMGFDNDDKSKIGEYFDAIASTCLADDFWHTLKSESPFNLITAAAPPTTAAAAAAATTVVTGNAEKLSIMTQFFLGEVNIFCFSNNLSRTNFGAVLDANPTLSLGVAQTVKASLARSENVEENLFRLINQHYREFGLSRQLRAEEWSTIAERFKTEYSTIQNSPHFDEFTLITPEKKGDFVSHHSTIALSFAQFMEMQFPGKSNRFFRERAREFREISGKLDHKNASVAADYEIDEKNLPKMLDSSKNIDLVATILVAELSESDRRVFQNLSPEVISSLMRSKYFDQLKARVISKLTDGSVQALFNQQFSSEVQTFQLTTAMERSLYTRVIAEKGPRALDNVSNTPRPDKLNRALQLLNIQILEPGIQASEHDGYVLRCPFNSVTQLVETHRQFQNSIHLTQDMARSLYRMVEERYGAADGRYIEMQSKDNRRNPDKINLALRLLDIRPEDIRFSEWEGYILTAKPDAINNINAFHRYIQTRGPRQAAAPLSATTAAAPPTTSAMSPTAAAAAAASVATSTPASSPTRVTPLSKSPPQISPRGAEASQSQESEGVSLAAQAAATAAGTQKISPRGKLERAGNLNPELLKMAGLHRQSPVKAQESQGLSASSQVAAASSPAAASSALASPTGADNQPSNINALMRQPYLPQIVREGAERSVTIYHSPSMAAVVAARKQKAPAGGRGADWIQKTTGETENALIVRLRSIPGPRTYSCGEIKNAMGQEKLAAQSTGPTFHVVEGLSVNYLHDAPLGKDGVVMLASQFDYQESFGPYDAPVSSYINDPTQGPQAQIEALWASLHRKAGKQNGTLPHALTEILPENLLSKYPNLHVHGYLNLGEITSKADKEMLLAHIQANIDKIKVLPQWAICEASGALQLQVCCAAPSFQKKPMPEPGSTDDKICQALVVAQYVATAQLAVIRSRETGQPVPLHLTMVGQGSFRNRPEVMREAMRQVAEVVNGENVQVFVHAFSPDAKAKLTEQLNAGQVHYDSMTADRFLTMPNPAHQQSALSASAANTQPTAAAKAAPSHRPSILSAFSGAAAKSSPLAVERPAAIPTQNIMIYSAQMSDREIAANQNRVAIKFPSQAERDSFVREFMEVARRSGMQSEIAKSLLTTISANPETVYIEPSKQRGPGVYVSANGELSLNLGHNMLRDFFKNRLGLSEGDANTPATNARGDNAVYFNKERLPPTPDRTKNIRTVGKTDVAPQEEKREHPKKK